MEFEKRLEKAIERGQRTQRIRQDAEAEQQLGEEELRRLHAQCRSQVVEHIEACLSKLAAHFPGFRYESIVGDPGWGASISRDDLILQAGKRSTFFSRLQIIVRPFSSSRVLELMAKGTIRNKEVYNRNNYRQLTEVDPTSFTELVDLWVLEYAELFAAAR